jgi:hypothetical protein
MESRYGNQAMSFLKSNLTRVLRRSVAAVGVLCCLATAGCEPQLDPEQYGKVIHRLPEIDGAKGEYPLPQLEEPGPKSPSEVLEDEK